MRSWSEVEIPTVARSGESATVDSGAALRLYDSADRAVRPVAAGPDAGMYVCGITPYDATHLGHAATYVTFDVINRVLRDAGHRVTYVQNVTDVDDPLFERAERDGVDWRTLGDQQTDLFRSDMEALRVVPPAEYVGATDAIDEVVAVIEKLLAGGAAYVVDDPTYPDVYYRYDATEQFGYESGFDRATMDTLFAERGGDPDRPGKRDPLDALLWRAHREGEPSWPAPFGAGRPGWHIECSAMAVNRLGFGFDIQGGGSDLIFPHHEFSAAHAEAAESSSDGGRFARHYVHAGMIGYQGTKMSKSLGNLVLVSQLTARGVDPAAIRLALYADHYRSNREWTDTLLEQAIERLALWRAAFALPSAQPADEAIERLRRHLADDLDTPAALDTVDAWARHALAAGGPDAEAPRRMGEAVDALLGVLPA